MCFFLHFMKMAGFFEFRHGICLSLVYRGVEFRSPWVCGEKSVKKQACGPMCTALGKEYTHFSRAAGTPSDVGYFEHRTWLILKCFAMEKNCIEKTLVGRWQFKTNPRTTTKTSTETSVSTAATSWWQSSKVMMRRGRPTNSLTTNSLSNQSTVPQKVPAGVPLSHSTQNFHFME